MTRLPRPAVVDRPVLQALSIPFGEHVLRGDVLAAPQGQSTVLLLHGGGSSTGEGFAALRAFLHARQVGTVAFDFVGHGRTGGAQLGSTLAQRVAQVLAVVQALALDPARLTLAGFSMGAYVAACAAERLAPAGLCLAIPAAYAPEAFEQPFGPAFSTVLRRPRSWAGSDAFEHVAQFTGHLLVLSAEHDAVVPAEIPHTYHERAVNACSREHHVVAGSGHDLSTHYAVHPGAREQAYEALARLCAKLRGDAQRRPGGGFSPPPPR
jgi:uncharacterized protein